MNKIKIGVACTRRSFFGVDAAVKAKNEVLDNLKKIGMAEIVDLEGVTDEGLLFSDDDLENVVDEFMRAKVDCVFFPHVNFGTERLVAKVSKAIGKPVLLWGPRDDAPLPNGTRERDSQCGIFATGKILRRFGVPFTYIINTKVTDTYFIESYKRFLATASVVKDFYNTKILQIDARPSDFWSMMYNEGELLEKFGIEIIHSSLFELGEGVKKILAENSAEFENEKKNLNSKMTCVKGEKTDKVCALTMYLRQTLKKHGCNSIAIQCWSNLQEILGGIVPCVSNGILMDEGIPVTCETDIHGAISNIMLQAAARHTKTVFIADMTIRHPENENSELLWHCGNFSPSLAKEGEQKSMGEHFILPPGNVGTGEFCLKDGEITICRFDGDNGHYNLFIGEGKTCDGPMTRGTYVWFEAKDWTKWEKKLVEGPYVHHCSGVYEKVAPILFEACKYIKNLEPDPVEPTALEIDEIWRGKRK